MPITVAIAAITPKIPRPLLILDSPLRKIATDAVASAVSTPTPTVPKVINTSGVAQFVLDRKSSTKTNAARKETGTTAAEIMP